jgi:SAM-dependent methyltransferase
MGAPTLGLKCPLCSTPAGALPEYASFGSYRYVRCPQCDLVFVSPIPSTQELTAYYNTSYRPDPAMLGKGAARWSPKVLEVLDEAMPSRGRLLEIGASFGFFLAAAREDGWDATGIEVGEEACAYARQHLHLPMLSGSLEDHPELTPASFDAVALFHLLEHVADPVAFVERCAELTKPGGFLVLRTPNSASLVSRVTREGWSWLCPPQHLYLYSARSITLLLEKVGFRVERLWTVRGDAQNNLVELAFGALRRLRAVRTGGGVPSDAPGRGHLTRTWYFKPTIATADVLYSPFSVLVDPWLAQLRLQPELGALARRR